MTWVKVCGMMRPGDVIAAVDAGADAVGIILVARSLRVVDRELAVRLAAAAGPAEVVILTEEAADTVVALARGIGATGVQPYGAHAAASAAAALDGGLTAYFPIGVDREQEIDLTRMPAGARPLLDTARGGVTGGTGVPFDWGRARTVHGAVIAGGLDPDNVGGAIAAAQPWGVDASSGLEAAVGIKDHVKVAAFVRAAKAASR